MCFPSLLPHRYAHTPHTHTHTHTVALSAQSIDAPRILKQQSVQSFLYARSAWRYRGRTGQNAEESKHLPVCISLFVGFCTALLRFCFRRSLYVDVACFLWLSSTHSFNHLLCAFTYGAHAFHFLWVIPSCLFQNSQTFPGMRPSIQSNQAGKQKNGSHETEKSPHGSILIQIPRSFLSSHHKQGGARRGGSFETSNPKEKRKEKKIGNNHNRDRTFL